MKKAEKTHTNGNRLRKIKKLRNKITNVCVMAEFMGVWVI